MAVLGVSLIGFDGSFELVPQVLVKGFELCGALRGFGGRYFGESDIQFWVVSFVSEKWRYSCSGVGCIVVGKLS